MLVALVPCGCAVRKLPGTYRLTRHDGGPVLFPPGINKDIGQRTFKAGIAPGTGSCESDSGIAVQRRGQGIRITVKREGLAKQSAAWLLRWSSDAEDRGCVAPGSATRLADAILDAVPLDPALAWRLVNSGGRAGYVELRAENRLQVDSPIFRGGAPAEPLVTRSVVAGDTGRSINIDVASPALLGFERAWYAVVPRTAQPGYTIAPLSAERHIDGQTETRPAPAVDYFRFDRDAAWFRLVYRTDRTSVLVGAKTYSELERLAQEVDADLSACQSLAGHFCAPVPKDVGVNPDVVVRVNGEERALPFGTNVYGAIQMSGSRPEDVLPRLSMMRRHAGRLVPVEFDRTAKDIFLLRLSGGETLAW